MPRHRKPCHLLQGVNIFEPVTLSWIGLGRGQVEGRAALLQVCGRLTDARIRSAIRAGVRDADVRLRSAAIRALCNARDPELLPDVLAVARTAINKVLAVTTDAGRRQAAEAVLKQIDAATDFIMAWQVAGPYAQPGKDYAALFDIPFAPEKPDAKDVTWRRLPSSTDPKQPWSLDLLKFLGGERRVEGRGAWGQNGRGSTEH